MGGIETPCRSVVPLSGQHHDRPAREFTREGEDTAGHSREAGADHAPGLQEPDHMRNRPRAKPERTAGLPGSSLDRRHRIVRSDA